MDRNIVSPFDVLAISVALRKESVDRNSFLPIELSHERESLSARRTWIEIDYFSAVMRQNPGRSPQGERG